MERIWLKSYPEGVPAEIDPDAYRSIGEFFAASVEQYRDRDAFVSMGRTMSFGELDHLSRAFAGHLRNVAALPVGARIALMMPNLLQYPVALFGALRAGLVVVNCNPLYSPRELHRQLEDSGAEAIVVLENFAQTLENAIAGTSVRVVVVTGVGDLLKRGRGMMVNFALRHIRRAVPPWRLPEATPFNRAIALGLSEAVEFPPVSPTDVAFLQYTGGTTGVPKGAMLTHRNMIANLQQTHAWLKSSMGSANELFVTALPLYHVFALTVNCFVPLMIGANNLLIPNPRDVRAFVKAMRQTPFTVITGVNTLFNMLLNDQEFLRLDFSRLELAVAGGMALQRAVAERWKAATGKPLIEGYGLTETSPIAACNPLDGRGFQRNDRPADALDRHRDPRPRGAGPAARRARRALHQGPAGDERLLEEAGRDGQGHDAKTDSCAPATSPGWMRRGYLTIVDRQKDMIIVSGFNVYPNEIEDVVMTHPGVQEVGAVGVPDLKSGEAVKIVVVRKDAALTEIELIAHCRKYLAGYKTPRHVEFRDTLPRTPVGKILRRDLREAPQPQGEKEEAR